MISSYYIHINLYTVGMGSMNPMGAMNSMMNGQNFSMGAMSGMHGAQGQVPPIRNSSYGNGGSMDPFSNLNSLGPGGQQKMR